MRELSSFEIANIAGACVEDHSYSREFWDSAAHGAGVAVGVFCSPVIFAGMVAYGITYATVSAFVGIGTAVYQGGAYVVGGVHDAFYGKPESGV